MAIKEYIDPEFEQLMGRKHDQTAFKLLWDRDDPWFDEPNIGRRDSKKAWSGVTKIRYNNHAFFLKKQENYFTYSVRPPLRQLVVQKEYSNIKLFESLGIPTLDIVYLGISKKLKKNRGIIITKALDRYMPLDEVEKIFLSPVKPGQIKIKKAVIKGIAKLIQKTHMHGLMHNCLYPKHIYVNKEFCETGQENCHAPAVRFIDLEGAKKVSKKSSRQLRDLETLNRRLPALENKYKIYFLLNYLNKTSLDQEARQLIKKVKSISR